MTDDIIEAAARALRQRYVYITRDEAEDAAATVCAVVTPTIRNAALERAAKVADDHELADGVYIAAAIRALKEQP